MGEMRSYPKAQLPYYLSDAYELTADNALEIRLTVGYRERLSIVNIFCHGGSIETWDVAGDAWNRHVKTEECRREPRSRGVSTPAGPVRKVHYEADCR